jgi:hypothetical protein
MSLAEIENLQRKVRHSIFYAAGLVFVVISVFMIKVWLLSDNQLSSNAEKWGQFGDYVGGILNPLMAFLAFYWLTQSVLIQKQELMDTKKALQESSQAQLKQEIHAGKTSRINALNSLLNSYNNDISNLRDNVEFLVRQLEKTHESRLGFSLTGVPLETMGLKRELASVNNAISENVNKRNEVIIQIKSLLAE